MSDSEAHCRHHTHSTVDFWVTVLPPPIVFELLDPGRCHPCTPHDRSRLIPRPLPRPRLHHPWRVRAYAKSNPFHGGFSARSRVSEHTTVSPGESEERGIDSVQIERRSERERAYRQEHFSRNHLSETSANVNLPQFAPRTLLEA